MKYIPLSITSLVLVSLSLLLIGCFGGERTTYDVTQKPTAETAHYKVGRPYKIKGEWYHPKEDYRYDETGIASWYGGNFHNKLTANGEIYNKHELTAAHKTLQMPSLARVTNLENGRSVVVRINDRGPYVSGRIIDMSKRAAELLGFQKQGVAKVRVQVLADESKSIAQAMQTYGSSPVKRYEARPKAESEVYRPSRLKSARVQAVRPHVYAPVEQVPLTSEPVEVKELLPTIKTIKPVARYTQMPVTSETNLYVQAGSFANKGNAYRLRDRLSDLGPVMVTEAMVRGSLFYRVRVGPLQTVRDADDMLGQVNDSGVNGARIFVAE